jgi:hypothetical protein
LHSELDAYARLRRILRAVLTLLLFVAVYLSFRKAPEPDARAIVSTASKPAAEVPSCGDKILRDDGIGKLRIGADIDSVKAQCRVIIDAATRGLEGTTERRIAVAFPSALVEGMVLNGRVWRLAVESPAFRTPDSLGVGSTLPELLRLDRARGMVSEGVLVLVSPAHCGLSFVLSGGIPALNLERLDRTELSKLPKSTRVVRVYVFGCHLGTRINPATTK